MVICKGGDRQQTAFKQLIFTGGRGFESHLSARIVAQLVRAPETQKFVCKVAGEG
jgi:hypothetical protein